MTDQQSSLLPELHKEAIQSMEQGDLGGALQATEKSLEIVGETNLALKAKLLANLGAIRAASQDFSKAQEAFELAAELFKAQQNPFDQAVQIGNIGSIYRDRGDYTKALLYYQKALASLQDHGDPATPQLEVALADQHANIGYACSQLPDVAAAITHFTSAAVIYEKFGHSERASLCQDNVAALQQTRIDK